MPGSIGPKGPAHVFKGMRMGGRMGGERVTTTNLKIAAIDAEKNILYVAGAIPGAINGFVFLVGAGDLQVNSKKKAEPQAAEVKIEEIAAGTKAEEAEVTEAKTEEVKE
jgi:large subunit ribosomal protein L3